MDLIKETIHANIYLFIILTKSNNFQKSNKIKIVLSCNCLLPLTGKILICYIPVLQPNFQRCFMNHQSKFDCKVIILLHIIENK